MKCSNMQKKNEYRANIETILTILKGTNYFNYLRTISRFGTNF